MEGTSAKFTESARIRAQQVAKTLQLHYEIKEPILGKREDTDSSETTGISILWHAFCLTATQISHARYKFNTIHESFSYFNKKRSASQGFPDS